MTLSSPSNLSRLQIGQMFTVNVNLTELGDEELVLLAVGVEAPQRLFDPPASVVAGPIISNPSSERFVSNIDVGPSGSDALNGDSIFIDGIFEAVEDGQDPLTSEGTFLSFNLTAARTGSGRISFDFVDALRSGQNELGEFGVETEIGRGAPLQVTVIPLPSGVQSTLALAAVLTIFWGLRRFVMRANATALGLAVASFLSGSAAMASSHREAPITALDRAADVTDVYAFVSYGANQQANQTPSFVTFILCVDPLLEPGNGPTGFPFDPSVVYEINVDSNHDARADFIFQVQFSTEYQIPDLSVDLAGVGANGANAPGTNTLVVPPKITSFDNPGLNQRQSYTVKLVTKGKTKIKENEGGAPMYAVPRNAGPRTIDYNAVFNTAIYNLADGIRAFAGTVDDPFFIDLGASFDTLNFRKLGSGTPGVLTPTEDAAKQNFASDTVSGYAVNAIALEVPIAMLTSTLKVEPASAPEATLGIWGSTTRSRVTIRRSPAPAKGTQAARRQVQRLANPLINELLIGIGSKDRWSMSRPQDDAQFADFLLDPLLPKVAEALYGGALAIPDAPRNDLLPLVTYAPPIAATGTPAGPVADLLRLNTGVPATPPAQQNRLGVLGGDGAGFPNGRRLVDDVVDITLRVVVGGVLVTPPFEGFDPAINGRLGDGVNVNDAPFRNEFPYLANCPDGRNRRHIDPGEQFPDGRDVPID